MMSADRAAGFTDQAAGSADRAAGFSLRGDTVQAETGVSFNVEFVPPLKY